MQITEGYQLPTIARLAPSLEQIQFGLSSNAIDDKKMESLTFSVSIEKISYESIAGLDEPSNFDLTKKMVKVQCDDIFSKKTEIGGLNKITNRIRTLKQCRETALVNKAIIYFGDAKNKPSKPNVLTPCMTETLRNGSTIPVCSDENMSFLKNKTKKSFSFRAKPEAKPKQAATTQKARPNRFSLLKPISNTLPVVSRKKILSTRK